MSADSKDQGVLSRWSKRKQSAREALPDTEGPDAPLSDVEPETDEAALEVLRERDPELAEKIAGIDIDTLTYEDDFSIFMNQKVPEFIRRKALSKLWLSNPVLANIDGLNDYDEDFTAVGSLVETLQSALSKDDADAVTGDDATGQSAGEPAQVAADEPAIESIDEVREGPPDDDTANDGGETELPLENEAATSQKS